MLAHRTRADDLAQVLLALAQRVEHLEEELAALRHDLRALRPVAARLSDAQGVASLAGAPGLISRRPQEQDDLVAGAEHVGDLWRVTMLGDFRLERDGHPAPACSSRRGQSILKFLLARPGHAADRSILVETFWPTVSAASGGHNLQMAIHSLRRSLLGWGPGGGDEVVLLRHDCYLLNPALRIDLDVERFRQACARGERALAAGDLGAARAAFEEARTLYAGDYLSDSPYEDWPIEQRTWLLDLRLSLLSRLSGLYARTAEWDGAAACCHEILAVDEFREDAYRQLMRCEAARGRRGAVRDVYQACQSRLKRELHVEPAAETRRVYERLMAGAEGAEEPFG